MMHNRNTICYETERKSEHSGKPKAVYTMQEIKKKKKNSIII